jgi:predicted Zn-dependent protease
MLLVEYSEVTSSPTPEPEVIPPAVPMPTVSEADPIAPIEHATPAEQPPKKATTAKDKAKSRKARIIELAKAMNAAETTQGKDHKEVKEKKEQPARPVNPSDEIIEEIRSTKDEVVPESDKQKEQMAIINEFIKTQPSISNAREREKDRAASGHSAGDLTPVKSGEFGDNIVSETLVEILIKQGKKDKAIEVLKKLIWKYPQKKSYFAGQIEDLKK